jgi:glycosyltransferase involved in cell wall biosynthesis
VVVKTQKVGICLVFVVYDGKYVEENLVFVGGIKMFLQPSPPLVSLVCPTYNRSRYLCTAIRCFTQQTYPSVELIIVDDSEEFATTAIPADGRIRYMRLDKRTPTGTKRNIGAQAANGAIIANLDDDDWSSPHRIQDEVMRLLSTGKSVTGYNASILYDEATKGFYKIAGGPPYYASGSSQVYWKTWWEKHPYPDCSFGEDSVFSRTARLADELAVAEPGTMLVVRRHATNTSDVYLPKLPTVSSRDIATEFFNAMDNPQPTLAYMWEEHDCTDECQDDAYRQYSRPAIEYKVSQLPEVITR